MRSRLPWILFALSLALNLSIIGGVLYVGKDRLFGPKNAAAFIAHLSDDLQLSAEQRQSLESLRAEVLAERAKSERQSGRWGDFAASVLEEQTFDAEAVRWVMIERSQPWREMTIKSLAELHAFVQQLNPRQRDAFLTRVREERSFLRRLTGPDE